MNLITLDPDLRLEHARIQVWIWIRISTKSKNRFHNHFYLEPEASYTQMIGYPFATIVFASLVLKVQHYILNMVVFRFQPLFFCFKKKKNRKVKLYSQYIGGQHCADRIQYVRYPMGKRLFSQPFEEKKKKIV